MGTTNDTGIVNTNASSIECNINRSFRYLTQVTSTEELTVYTSKDLITGTRNAKRMPEPWYQGESYKRR